MIGRDRGRLHSTSHSRLRRAPPRDQLEGPNGPGLGEKAALTVRAASARSGSEPSESLDQAKVRGRPPCP